MRTVYYVQPGATVPISRLTDVAWSRSGAGEFDLISVNDVRSNDRAVRLERRRDNLTYAAVDFVNPKRIRFRSACRQFST